MRSSLTFTASNRRSRLDNDVPRHFYIYGKDSTGRTRSKTVYCTRKEANQLAIDMALQYDVLPSAFTVRTA